MHAQVPHICVHPLWCNHHTIDSTAWWWMGTICQGTDTAYVHPQYPLWSSHHTIDSTAWWVGGWGQGTHCHS